MATKVTEKHRTRAVEILEGMAEIVRAEQVGTVGYLTEQRDEERFRAGAICRGHQACAVGSLYLAAGVKPVKSGRLWELPEKSLAAGGSSKKADNKFVKRRPGLRLAFVALNQVAAEYAERHPEINMSVMFEDELERLFEGSWGARSGGRFNRRELLRVIASAKRRVAKLEEV